MLTIHGGMLTKKQIESALRALWKTPGEDVSNALDALAAYARVLDVLEGEHIDTRGPEVERQSGESATYELGRLDVARLVRAALEGKP